MNERRFGILIASSRFPDEPKLEDLRFPENDVDGLNEILTSKDLGQFTQTFLLKNMLHHEILLKINQVLREADKNDLVLIYYSGHGKLNLAGKLHLATTDSIINALEATSIPVSTIRDYVDISSSNKIVLILDCCFSGAAGEAFARGGVDDQLHLVSGGRGTYILTASTGIQVAQEKESDQYGVFTKHLIEGIKSGEADLDSDGRITMADLYRYVHVKVLDEGFQEPMKWDLNVRGEMVIARSSKTPRKERGKQLREILFDLAKKGFLPDDILDKARQVILLEQDQLSEEDRIYDRLLDQLLKKRLEPAEFIRKWDKVKPETPALKHKPSETIPEKPESIKLKPPEPKPDSPATSEPKLIPSVPIAFTLKTSNALKLGAVVGVIVLLIVVIWWWGSRPQVNEAQQQVNEVRQKMEKLDRQTLNLVNAVAEFDKPEQIEKFARQRETLSHQVEGFSEQATKAGMGSQLEQFQERLKQVQIQLAKKDIEFSEVRQVMKKLDRQALNLESALAKLENPKQLGELYRQRDILRYQIEGVSKQATKAGLGMEMEELQERLKQVQIQLANKEKELFTTQRSKIFVVTVPENAMVKILNINQRFKQGMELEPGRYHLEVAAEGHETQRRWVDLVAGHEETFRFELAKIKPAQTTSPDSPNALEDPRVQEAIHILLQSADRDAFEHAKRLLWEAGYSKSITFSKSQLRLSPKTEELLIERLREIRIRGNIED